MKNASGDNCHTTHGTSVPTYPVLPSLYFRVFAMESIAVLIADDHTKLRDLIHERLEREPDLQVVAVAGNSMQAVELALANHPRIVLIDPMMLDGLGLDAVRQIRSHLPEAIVVILTAFADTAQKMEWRRSGVEYILDKGIASADLIGILRRAGSKTGTNHS